MIRFPAKSAFDALTPHVKHLKVSFELTRLILFLLSKLTRFEQSLSVTVFSFVFMNEHHSNIICTVVVSVKRKTD